MQTLYALDLTEIQGADNIWRPRRSAEHPTKNHLRCPTTALFHHSASGLPPPSHGEQLLHRCGSRFLTSADKVRDYSSEARLRSLAVACHSYRARLRLKAKQAQSAGSSTSLFLEIDPSIARIGIAPDSWSSVSETVLLIAQFWRFLAIDHLLDKLVD